MIALEARRLQKRLGSRNILVGVDLAVEQGRFLSLFGPNGAGKSTLLRVLAGLIPPGGGEVHVDGRPVLEQGPNWRRSVGFLSHASMLYDSLTARENLTFYAKLYGVPQPAERAQRLLAEVGLELFANEAVRGFSRGMVQRLAVARAVVHEPRVLLLDEPYTGLDPRAADVLTSLLREYKAQGRTILMVSHHFAEGLALADDLAVLVGGRVAVRRPRGELTPEAWAEEYRRLVG